MGTGGGVRQLQIAAACAVRGWLHLPEEELDAPAVLQLDSERQEAATKRAPAWVVAIVTAERQRGLRSCACVHTASWGVGRVCGVAPGDCGEAGEDLEDEGVEAARRARCAQRVAGDDRHKRQRDG